MHIPGFGGGIRRSPQYCASGLAVALAVFAYTPASGAQLAAGNSHTCAVTSAGGLKCWGSNFSGELGIGTAGGAQFLPVFVNKLRSGVAAVAAGQLNTCAVTTAGGLMCWGNNSDGQLGKGTAGGFSPVPVNVRKLTSGVADVGVGTFHICALTDAGGVKCWGRNDNGQVGDGTEDTDRLVPVNVSGLTSGVAAIAVSAFHSCALTTAGGVKCWGFGGTGAPGNSLTPFNVSGLASGVTAIAAGGSHSCALTDAGGVKCWGSNTFGQLGDPTVALSLTPVDVSGLASGVVAITAGSGHTCALTDTGRMKCWGNNTSGELGDNTISANRLTPVNVRRLTSGVDAISAGSSHTCAVVDPGILNCWGDNDAGEVGDGTDTQRSVPVKVRHF